MSWEPVDRWPGDAGGEGAFRGASEPVVAARGGPTAWERARLWWHSTPELPVEHVARRAALTNQFVYVERRDGRKERAPRARLRGVRRVGARLIFGVIDGEDLVLPRRPTCALEKALLAQLGGGADEAWVGWRNVAGGTIIGSMSLVGGAGLLSTYPLRSFLASVDQGLWTSERALGFYAGWAALLLGVALVGWVPSRARVDQLGVEIRRGLIPWLPFFLPAERFRVVRVKEVIGNRKGSRYLAGYEVTLVLKERERLASLLRRQEVPASFFSAKAGSDALGRAAALARWLGRILGAEVMDRPR